MAERGKFDAALLEITTLRAERYRPVPLDDVLAVRAEVPFTLEDGTPVSPGWWIVNQGDGWRVVGDLTFHELYQRIED